MLEIIQQNKKMLKKSLQISGRQASISELHKSIIKKQSATLNPIKVLRIDEDLRRLKKLHHIQKSINKDTNQVDNFGKSLEQVEKKIHQAKQKMIKKQLQTLQQRKRQRQKFDLETNKSIVTIKKKQKLKQLAKMQVQKKQYLQQPTQLHNTIRYREPINFEVQKPKQYVYQHLKSQKSIQNDIKTQAKRSIRVKSQISSKYSNEFEGLSFDFKSMMQQRIRSQFQQAKQKTLIKKEQLSKMLQKRLKYGNRVQSQYKNNRVHTQVQQSRIKKQVKQHWNKINKEIQQKINTKKPKLDTNLPKIQSKDWTKHHLKRIKGQNGTIVDKLNQLKRIEQSVKEKTKNNNPQALDMLAELTLVKAQLYLKA